MKTPWFIHTHGRNGSYNPHLHILLGEGGINLEINQWVLLNVDENFIQS
ncbi:transposase [Shewanella surugensis]